MKNYSPPACLQSERWDAWRSAAAAVSVVATSSENKGHTCRNAHRAATSNPCCKINSPRQICDIFICRPGAGLWSTINLIFETCSGGIQRPSLNPKAWRSRGISPSHVFCSKIQAQKMCGIQFNFDKPRTKIKITKWVSMCSGVCWIWNLAFPLGTAAAWSNYRCKEEIPLLGGK